MESQDLDALAPFYSLHCPVPAMDSFCGHELFVKYVAHVFLCGKDFKSDDFKGHKLDSDGSQLYWRVECAAGHVLLLPSDTYAVTESDEYRIFGPRDMLRLKALLRTMNSIGD